PLSPWSKTAGCYRTADSRWIQLHTNFAHHEAGMQEVLGCAAEREAVKAAVLGWEGESLEAALVERGMPAGLMRSHEEWEAHAQSAAVALLPLFEISPLGESPPEPIAPEGRSAGVRPLSGVRVLDLTRVIAGPVCGRTLASHGAEVLRIGAPHLPTLPFVWLDMAQGKRSAWLDLREPVDHAQLEQLIQESDVFVQGYRPGTLAARGFGPESVARLRPGIVYVTLSAYGHAGPWAERRGYDSLVQTVSGFAEAGMQAARVDRVFAKPAPLPCQALDHATGYLAAMGAMVGLQRRAEQGGSWLVRVSLAQTGRWLWDLGRVDGLRCADPTVEDVGDLLVRRETEEGVVSTVRPPVEMSSTPARWE
ncbi:MAG TPA: CoA transferase, partial [Dehalococcoidia bacterium]|nr:CoA transferase [Dehalococcoidia bacterium]